MLAVRALPPGGQENFATRWRRGPALGNTGGLLILPFHLVAKRGLSAVGGSSPRGPPDPTSQGASSRSGPDRVTGRGPAPRLERADGAGVRPSLQAAKLALGMKARTTGPIHHPAPGCLRRAIARPAEIGRTFHTDTHSTRTGRNPIARVSIERGRLNRSAEPMTSAKADVPALTVSHGSPRKRASPHQLVYWRALPSRDPGNMLNGDSGRHRAQSVHPNRGMGQPMHRTLKLAATIALAAIIVTPGVTVAEENPRDRIKVTELATVVDGPCTDDNCSLGSTVGPDGALYVTDHTAGRVQRVDPRDGTVTTFADGLPQTIPGVAGGGVADVAFRGRTAFVLVAGTGEFWTELSGSPVAPVAEGLYRLDQVGSGRTRATLVADIYAWSEAHPPRYPGFFVPGGYTYAMQPYRNGFLITDGHHNRVLRVQRTGAISVFFDFNANVVPTGLDRIGSNVLVGQAGPVPHVPDTGRLVALRRHGLRMLVLATGAPLLVDVEIGRHTVYGLAQGDWPYEGQPDMEGAPASPDTGKLMRADHLGRFRTIVSHLDRPTTFELIGNRAFVVTINGKVLKITGLGQHN